MTILSSHAQRAVSGWLAFWFGEVPPHTLLAWFRIGTALMLLYMLFVRSFDLSPEFTAAVRDNPALHATLDPIAWPFSLFSWVDAPQWQWGVHITAIVVATAFLAGIATPVTAAASLILQLAYTHFNPAMLLGLDGLLTLALVYLSVVSSGNVLGVFTRVNAPPRPLPPYLAHLEPNDPLLQDRNHWGGLVVRVMQIHLCLIYFQSGLAKLATDWLAGSALWHPRLVEMGVPYSLDLLQAEPHLTGLITYSLVLFELFYGVLVWVPALRYLVLATAVGVHLTVGIAWGLLPFNLMMIVMNIVFIRPRHLEAATERIRMAIILPWLARFREG